MNGENEVPADHPRAESLRIREKVIVHQKKGVVALAGLIAHGRGEAFDYLLGEKTTKNALKAIRAASSVLLLAEKPVISVNGNAAALVANDIVKLAKITGAKIEVNLFYRSADREESIKKLLEEAGATQVLGVGGKASAKIPELSSERRRVDPRGILVADAVLVPLEDGDRTEALVRMDKKVIAIDLNPLSRTAQLASITIVDNIVRAMPTLAETTEELKKKERKKKLKKIVSSFNNQENLAEAFGYISKRLSSLADKGKYVSILEMTTK
jgi:4-phosphopantoate--beta-alanine ligase